MIMTIAKYHPQKEDMKTRIKIELEDSIGVCFTGRMNRLVNSLIGFVDGIQIGLSSKEELQMKIGAIVQSLIQKKIKTQQAVKEMNVVFDSFGETDFLTDATKQAYLSALDDYADDEEENDEEIPIVQ